MRYLRFFENFNKNNKIENFNYLTLEKLNNGLKLILNENGRELLENTDEDKIKSEEIAYDLFDDIQGNSEYIYHYDLGESGFGLTSAPGITDGYYYDDDMKYKEVDDTAEVYYYNDYALKNFIVELLENGYVVFTKA